MGLTVAESPEVLPNFFHSFPKYFKTNWSMEYLRFDHVKDCHIVQVLCQKSVGDLFIGFLKYFCDMDFEKYGISITEKIERMDPKLFKTRESKERYQPIIIQDPFHQGNPAIVISTKERLANIIKVFKSTLERILSLGRFSVQLEDICRIQSERNKDIETVDILNLTLD